MFNVISSGKYGYIGGSEKLANQMFNACVKSGYSVCMERVVDGKWREVKEVLAQW